MLNLKAMDLKKEKIGTLIVAVGEDKKIHDDPTINAMIQQALKKLGCKTLLEPVIVNPAYSFAISKKHYKLLNRELSKILRCKSSLALVLIHVDTDENGANLPSMMGPIAQELEEHFRESDTLIGIDEARMALVGFSTDKEGLGRLENKIKRVFKTLLGE